MDNADKNDLYREKLLIGCVHQANQLGEIKFSFDDVLTVPLVYQMKLQKAIIQHRKYARENPNHFKEILLDILETATFKHKKSIKTFQRYYGDIKKKADYCNPKNILLCGLAKSEFKDFLYVIGVWDKKTLNRYEMYEKSFMGEKRRVLEEQVSSILAQYYPNECLLLSEHGMRIPQIVPIERPSFDCVLEYAQERGALLSPRGKIIDLAKETYRYLNLFAHTLFPTKNDDKFFYDGPPDTVRWLEKCQPYHELEETVLFHSVKIFADKWQVSSETGAFAGSMLLQARIADNLSQLSHIAVDKISSDSYRQMILPMDLISYLPQNYPQSEQTKRNLLVQTINGTLQYLENYPDKEWRTILYDWYQKCTDGITENIDTVYPNISQPDKTDLQYPIIDYLNDTLKKTSHTIIQKQMKPKNKKSDREKE